MFKTTLKVTVFAASAAAIMASAVAQAPVELRYASSSPPKTVWAAQTERFTKAWSDESKGTLKIDAFINSQLGSEQDTIQQVARGRIDMGGYSVTAASLIVPELALVATPFLFNSQAEQDCVLDNHVTKPATAMLAAKGLQFISWSLVGTTHFIAKKPILTPDDIKGMKARSQPTKIGAFTWSTFGANPNPLPVTEWNSAMQTGLAEVADSSSTYYVFSGLNKIAPVLTLSGHQENPGIVVMNKAAFDKLTADQKAALERVRAADPAAKQRSEIRGFELKVVEMHKQGGGTVAQMSPEQLALWRKGIEPMWPKMVEAIGGDAPKMWKIITDGIAACRKPA
jgi:TRAP-type C4-dicarboxylate transport system substrate-binding protein